MEYRADCDMAIWLLVDVTPGYSEIFDEIAVLLLTNSAGIQQANNYNMFWYLEVIENYDPDETRHQCFWST